MGEWYRSVRQHNAVATQICPFRELVPRCNSVGETTISLGLSVEVRSQFILVSDDLSHCGCVVSASKSRSVQMSEWILAHPQAGFVNEGLGEWPCSLRLWALAFPSTSITSVFVYASWSKDYLPLMHDRQVGDRLSSILSSGTNITRCVCERLEFHPDYFFYK